MGLSSGRVLGRTLQEMISHWIHTFKTIIDLESWHIVVVSVHRRLRQEVGEFEKNSKTFSVYIWLGI